MSVTGGGAPRNRTHGDPSILGDLHPKDRFKGLFSRPWPRPSGGGLMAHAPISTWMELVGGSSREGTYTFQGPLEGRSGVRIQVDGATFLLLSSYDYLGLVGHSRIEAAAQDAVRKFGTGTGGVRLLTGTNVLHRELEGALAEVKESEEAIVFTSGYLANLAAITALFGPRDLVIMDELCHRSVIDGCRLARVRVERFRHNDPDHLDHVLSANPKGRRLVVVEGIYSMDGDTCPLREIVEVKSRHGAFLMVDEAHSLGVLGARGRGAHEEHGVPSQEVDIWMGSLSKAIPSVGGFLAGRRDLMAYLQHGSAPFMFSAALCPPAAAAALEALGVMDAEGERRARLGRNARRLRHGLSQLGFDTGLSNTPVIPVILGEIQRTLEMGGRLWTEGISVSAVIPPAVQHDQARLRLCATAAMEDGHLDEALSAFALMADQDRETAYGKPRPAGMDK